MNAEQFKTLHNARCQILKMRGVDQRDMTGRQVEAFHKETPTLAIARKIIEAGGGKAISAASPKRTALPAEVERLIQQEMRKPAAAKPVVAAPVTAGLTGRKLIAASAAKQIDPRTGKPLFGFERALAAHNQKSK